MSAYRMKIGSEWRALKRRFRSAADLQPSDVGARFDRLSLWPQDEPTLTSTDERRLAVVFLP